MPMANVRFSAAAPCPQAAVARKAPPRSRQGTKTMPRATRLSAIDPTAVAGQTSGNQATAEVTLSPDWGHPCHQLTLALADGPKIDLSPAWQLLAQPCRRLSFMACINVSTGQSNGVGAVVITHLKQRTAAHLKHLSGLNRRCPKQQQQTGQDKTNQGVVALRTGMGAGRPTISALLLPGGTIG